MDEGVSAPVLAARKVTVVRGAQMVLDQVDLVVDEGGRLGVLGRNGAGKSTLLRVLAGLEDPTDGAVEVSPPELTVGYLLQEPDDLPGETAAAFLRRRTGLAAAEAAMEAALAAARQRPRPAELAAYDDALARFLALGGDDHDARAPRVLAGVGLADRVLGLPAASLSGGERVELGLAAILLARFDVLLLDEPTNNLDFAGLDRLERFLVGERGRPGGGLAGGVAPQRRRGGHHGRRARAPGGFPVRPGRPGGRLAGPAGGHRPERLGQDHPAAPAHGRAHARRRTGAARRRRGGRLPRSGPRPGPRRAGGRRCRGGPGHAARAGTPGGRAPAAAGAVAAGQVRPRRRARRAPGGGAVTRERSRAWLAVLTARGTNLLILDEPTNHLDLDAVEELEQALAGFDGTLVVVTHDRRMLSGLRVTRRLEVDAGTVRELPVPTTVPQDP